MHARAIVSTHPDVMGNVNEALVRCVDECYACGLTCTVCADACLAEEMVERLKQCVRVCSDCADLCATAGRVASRRTGSNEEVIRLALAACAEACRVCAEECEKHADMHEHCRLCGEACRRCEQACRNALESMR